MKQAILRKAGLAPVSLLLLVALGLLWGRAVQAGEKREIIDPGINASHKVMNGTPWVMPPEVEALFPKDAAFNETLWKEYNRFPLRDDERMRTERHNLQFMRGNYNGVCLDQQINVNIYGGMFFSGCYIAKPHLKYSQKLLLQQIDWESLSPQENVNIIKKFYDLRGLSYPLNRRDEPWKTISPIIKRLIVLDGRVLLQKAKLDVNNMGTNSNVYRFTFDPYYRRLSPDNKTCRLWEYFIPEEDELSSSFNSGVFNMFIEPFLYNGKTYYISDNVLYIGFGLSRNEFGLATICEY